MYVRSIAYQGYGSPPALVNAVPELAAQLADALDALAYCDGARAAEA